MKADISIVQSKKGTEIMVSGNKINKYGILAAILFTVPILLLFRWIHGEDMAHVSFLIFWLCALAGFGVNLLLHALFFGIFSPKGFRSISFVKHKGGIRFCHCNEPIRMWQYRTTCFLPILLLGILPLLYGMATGNYYFTYSEHSYLSVAWTTSASFGNCVHSAKMHLSTTVHRSCDSIYGKVRIVPENKE